MTTITPPIIQTDSTAYRMDSLSWIEDGERKECHFLLFAPLDAKTGAPDWEDGAAEVDFDSIDEVEKDICTHIQAALEAMARARAHYATQGETA